MFGYIRPLDQQISGRQDAIATARDNINPQDVLIPETTAIPEKTIQCNKDISTSREVSCK